MTKIIKDIDIAADEIIKGNVIGLPTETVYGLGANALNENAVLKIFETKERPLFNPLIVHVSVIGELEKYGVDIPDEVYNLAEKFSPGPITYIVRKNKIIPDIVSAGLECIALRIPSHKMFREVLFRSEMPIAAPSANRSGKISPTSARDVLSELEGKIKYILDGGNCEIGIESTVMSFVGDEVKILRHGAVTKKEIEKVTGKILDGMNGKIISPGQSKNHYAPVTPLYIVQDFENLEKIKEKRIGVLDFSCYRNNREIALNLYSDMRKLDTEKFDLIICRKVKEQGLGIAINDRLQRASLGEMKFIDHELKVAAK